MGLTPFLFGKLSVGIAVRVALLVIVAEFWTCFGKCLVDCVTLYIEAQP